MRIVVENSFIERVLQGYYPLLKSLLLAWGIHILDILSVLPNSILTSQNGHELGPVSTPSKVGSRLLKTNLLSVYFMIQINPTIN